MPGKLMQSAVAKCVLATLACLLCIVSSSLLSDALAHNLGQSYVYLQVRENMLSARVEMPIKELNQVLNLGLPAEKKIRSDDIEPHIEQIQAYVDEHLTLDCAPQACSLIFQDYGFLNTTFAQFLKIDYALDGFQQMPEAIDATYDVILEQLPQHTTMLLVEENWMTGTFQNESEPSMIFRQPGQTQTLDLTSGSLWQGFSTLVYLGIIHFIKGVDHVLFLVALLLPSVLSRQEDSTWKPVNKLSTAFVYSIKVAVVFAVAHSITLWLASLQVVEIPARMAESLIAASIGLAVVDIFYPIFRRRLWLILFLLGLFHGFALANALIELGATSQKTVLSVFGFNLGLEIGQLMIIAVILPVIYWLRNQRFYLSFVIRVGAVLLGAISLYWFIERAFNVNIRVLPVLQSLF